MCCMLEFEKHFYIKVLICFWRHPEMYEEYFISSCFIFEEYNKQPCTHRQHKN